MNRKRNAYTLIEILTVVSVMGFLLLLTSSTLFSLFASQRRLSERTVAIDTLSRLSLQLRADAHQAREASLIPEADGDPDTLTLRMLDEGDDPLTVEYLADAAGVRRIVKRRGEPVHRELYRLHAHDIVRWQLIDEKPPRLVLRIGPQAGSESGQSDKPDLDGAKDDDVAAASVTASGAADFTLIETRVGLLTGGTGLTGEEGGS